MTDLLSKQFLFNRYIPFLLLQAQKYGYEYVLGEVERSDATAELYARQGKGIRKSNHRLRLALDLYLYRDGIYLTNSTDYAILGSWWKSQHPLFRWGGDFKQINPKTGNLEDAPDGNHFSVEYLGVK